MPDNLKNESGWSSTDILLPESRFALKRFALKLAMILAFAGIQASTPWGFADALAVLAGGSAFMAAVLARVLRQRARGKVLSYWDEALAFLVITLVASLWWHEPQGPVLPTSRALPAVQRDRQPVVPQQHFR